MYDKTVKKANRQGYVQVYTGCGKGKTTAALGLALRALGHGKRVLLIQFLKKGGHFGEIKAARRFNRFKILQTGRSGWVSRRKISREDKKLAEEGLAKAQRALKDKKYDLIILDELNPCVHFGLLRAQQVKQVLKERSANVEIVITGRYADQEILRLADLISEIKELKHYYKKGVIARKGIEY